MFCFDGTGPDRVFLGAPRHFVDVDGMILRPGGSEPFWVLRTDAGQTQAGTTASTAAGKEAKIPRPPNAYILYRKERHNTVKEANPGITNNEICKSKYLKGDRKLIIRSSGTWTGLECGVARGAPKVQGHGRSRQASPSRKASRVSVQTQKTI